MYLDRHCYSPLMRTRHLAPIRRVLKAFSPVYQNFIIVVAVIGNMCCSVPFILPSVPATGLVRGLCRAARTGPNMRPGFPTLARLLVEGHKEFAMLRVFQMDSK